MSNTIEVNMDSDGVSLITLPASSGRMVRKCQTCYKAFARSTDLRRHTDAVHLKIKSFKCEVCGKSFTQKTGLRTHMNGHSGNAPYGCRIQCGHPPFRDPSSRIRHEYEQHAPPGFECPEGCGSFKRKDALKAHVIHRHRDKASTYTEEQMSSKMSRARFNEEFLRPAIERAKARRRAEGYVSDEDYDTSKSALEDLEPLALVSDAPLAGAAPSHSEGDSVGPGQGATTLDPHQSKYQEKDDTPMKSPRASSPFGQWVHTRDVQKAMEPLPPMQTTPPRSAAPSPPTPPLPISGRQIPHSPQRSSPLRSTPITAAPRLVPNELPKGTQSSPINTTFPGMTTSPITFTSKNALGLDFDGPGGGNNLGLPYFPSSVAALLPAFPTRTESTIDPTKHYYRRVAELPIGSHGQGSFSSPPSLMGSPALSPAHQSVDESTATLGGLSPSSRSVTDPSFLEDGIMI